MRSNRVFSKVSVVVLAGATALSGAALVTPTVANADYKTQTPSADPIATTPHILDNQGRALARVGSRIVVGGDFTQIKNYNSTTTFDQPYLFSYDPATGKIDQNFFPAVNGEVNAVLAHPDGNKVWVAGAFSRINGVTESRVALLNINTGAIVSSFDAPTVSAAITSMRLANNKLYIAGDFGSVGTTDQRAIAALDPATGALTNHITSVVSGTLQAGTGVPSIKSFDISANGKKLVAIGNFTAVDGKSRSQIAVWNTGGATAKLAPWGTQRYGNVCNPVFPTYMRDVDIAPNNKFFVVVTTGSYRSTQLCDTAARWEFDGKGTNRQPYWVNWTGGDTLTSVEVTGSMAYLGGHMRWLNNPYRGDNPGPGAWPTEGLAVVDTRNGLPFSWNPGRARGLGVFDFLPEPGMLWSVSDTNTWANEFHPRLAGFPFVGNEIPTDTIGRIPGDVWQLGGVAGAPNTNSQRGIGFDGTNVENPVTQPGQFSWSNARGAFAVDGTVYTAWNDSTFTAQSWDGSTFGAPQDIDLYEGASNLAGYSNNFINDLAKITGIFYDPSRARMYYTMTGSTSLFWRSFLPESRVVGAARNVLPNSSALTPNRVKGMFLAGQDLYFADSQNGALKRVTFDGKRIVGTASTVNATTDWRANAMFLSSQFAQLADNVPPTSSFTTKCTGRICTVNATKSSDPDGGVSSYSVDYGDGTVIDGATSQHSYTADGDYSITVTVTDNRGMQADSSKQVSVTLPPNVDPEAAFAFDCWGLDCDFDASDSADTDGTIVSYDWTFGAEGTDAGVLANHVFSTGGTYDVTLTVTDDRGGTNSVMQQITVNPIATTVAFRDSVTVDGGGNNQYAIQVPNTVQANDLMLLYVTNGAERTPVTPNGWTALGSQVDDQLYTHVFWRFATAGSAGATVSGQLQDGNGAAASAPEVSTLVAYSGVAAPPIAASASRSEQSTVAVGSHNTPGINVPASGAWVVSYWADRTNSGAGNVPTASWTPPGNQVFRGDAYNTGTTPRVSSLVTDDGGPVVSGARSGLSAAADVASVKATMWTIVLASQ